jgi:hypothetical protein
LRRGLALPVGWLFASNLPAVADPRLRIPLIAPGRIAIVIAERLLIQLDFEHQGI